jgi:4-amino-4-deoxy-L-arabinose transferase-like glycosyltransferase
MVNLCQSDKKMDLTSSCWKAFAVVAAIWAICYLPGLGKLEFQGEEGRRAVPAVEMLKTGNWAMPRIADRNYYSKPPGINWIVAGSFVLTGEQSELTARLPSVIFTLAFAALLIWLPICGLSIEARFISAISFLTTVAVFEKGRLIEVEAVYIALTGAATILWLYYWWRNSSRWLMWIIPSIFLGYGNLVKGPFIFIFFYCVVVGVMFYSNRLKELFRLEHFVGIFVFLLISLWWFYLASQQAPPIVIATELSGQLMIRVIREIILLGWAKIVLRSFAGLLPWLIIAPILWDKKLIAEMSQPEQNIFRGCRLGTVVSFVVIDLLPGTAARYSLPAVTTLCLLLGWALSRRKEWVSTDQLWKTILLICLPVSCLSAIAGLIFVSRLPWSFAALGFSICTTAVVYWKRKAIQNTTILSLVTAAAFAVAALQYSTFGLDIAKPQEDRKPTAMAINNIVPSDQTLHIYDPGTFLNAVIFTLKPKLVFVYDPNSIDESVHYILIRKADLEAVDIQNRVSSRSPEIIYEAPERLNGDYRLVRLK